MKKYGAELALKACFAPLNELSPRVFINAFNTLKTRILLEYFS